MINQTIHNIQFLSGKYFVKNPDGFVIFKNFLPNKIKEVNLHGKLIFIILENDFVIEFSHGMTGFWNISRQKNSRIEIKMKNDRLFFEDSRNFSRVYIYNNIKEYDYRIKSLGERVLDLESDFENFHERIIKKKKSKISVCLLDQYILSGIGNYLRCEILWYCKIHPDTKIKDISKDNLLYIFNVSINMSRFYSNLSNNINLIPKKDTFVYMQKSDIFGNEVKRKVINSRTMHFVEF